MDRLATLYGKLLGFGFISIREAIHSQDDEWANAEVELLHNVPSLLEESNVERHRYFWFTEREHYLDWLRTSGRERPQSRMKIYYEPIWQEMEPILLDILSCPQRTVGTV
jgi:hypothetical protein